MSLPHVLGRLIDRRLSALERHLQAAIEGDVTAVHQARVASRRLREALPVAGASAPKKRMAKVLGQARRITRALGPVRELDVALGLLDDLGHADPSLADAIAATRACVVEAREDRRRALLERVDRDDFDRLARRVARLTGTAEAGDVRWRGVLAERAARRAAALLGTIEKAGMLYAAERLHAVRIAAKRLRYVLEVAAETRAVSCARAVSELKRMQDALGQLHDLQVLAHYASVARLRSEPGGAAATALAEFIGRIEDECRRLHAGFLGRRMRLVAAAADTRDRIVPRLQAGGVVTARRRRRHS